MPSEHKMSLSNMGCKRKFEYETYKKPTDYMEQMFELHVRLGGNNVFEQEGEGVHANVGAQNLFRAPSIPAFPVIPSNHNNQNLHMRNAGAGAGALNIVDAYDTFDAPRTEYIEKLKREFFVRREQAKAEEEAIQQEFKERQMRDCVLEEKRQSMLHKNYLKKIVPFKISMCADNDGAGGDGCGSGGSDGIDIIATLVEDLFCCENFYEAIIYLDSFCCEDPNKESLCKIFSAIPASLLVVLFERFKKINLHWKNERIGELSHKNPLKQVQNLDQLADYKFFCAGVTFLTVRAEFAASAHSEFAT